MTETLLKLLRFICLSPLKHFKKVVTLKENSARSDLGYIFLAVFDLCSVKRGINPFPNKPRVLHVCSTSLLKTLWEKEKSLVTSNFSFSHSVFYPFGELPAIFSLAVFVTAIVSAASLSLCKNDAL